MNIFCSLLLASSIASATEQESIDYADIIKGQRAPFSGKLLKEEALIKIIVSHETEIKKLSADHDFKISKLELNSQLRYDMLNLKYTSETEMYKTMIIARDDQLRIDSKKDVLQRWGIYGSFILGALTTVGIAYAVDNVE
jgi:hypothetical protein